MKVSSEPQFKRWQAYQKAWKKEPLELQKVMMNTKIEDLKLLKIQGKSKLAEEIQSCMNVP